MLRRITDEWHGLQNTRHVLYQVHTLSTWIERKFDVTTCSTLMPLLSMWAANGPRATSTLSTSSTSWLAAGGSPFFTVRCSDVHSAHTSTSHSRQASQQSTPVRCRALPHITEALYSLLSPSEDTDNCRSKCMAITQQCNSSYGFPVTVRITVRNFYIFQLVTITINLFDISQLQLQLIDFSVTITVTDPVIKC